MAAVVVMLPGLDGTGRLFERFVSAAPPGVEARAVAYPPDEVLDVASLAERVALPDVPFVLLGESFSGPVALEVAARRPSGLIAVVLVATFVSSPVPRLLARLPLEAMFRWPPPRMALQHALCGGDAALAAKVGAAVGMVAPKVLAARLRVVLECDARAALAACPVPLLYMQATADRVVPARCGEEIARTSAELVREEGPHLLLQGNPRGAWEAIANTGWLHAHRPPVD